MYEKSYGTARLVLGIVVVTGWIVIAVGLIALVTSLSVLGGPNWGVMMPGIVMLVSGLFLVATSQVSFAVLDQADISRANLVMLRKLVDAQGLPLQSKVPTPVATPASKTRKEPTLRSGEDSGDHR